MKIDNFKIEDWFNAYERLSKYDMADTCVESLSLNELFEIVGDKDKHLEAVLNKKLNYGDIQGSCRLKHAISNMYESAGLEDISVTHGAIGANQLVMLAMIERGDEVLSILPTYQQHYSIPKSIGAKVKTLFLKEENNWLPDLEELECLVTPKTKIICMNNPNNPTGAVMPLGYLERIADIARRNGTYVLCDEVYRGLEHDGVISRSMFDIYERGISTGSMSKVFSLAGLRLGWIAAPCEVMEKVIIQREYNTISVSAVDDYFAAIAIENKDRIIKRNLDIILRGKKILSDWIEKNPYISWVEPKGGTTALIKYDNQMGSVELCKKLLADTGVLFLPASTLEMEGYLRIGYCSDVKMLQTGLGTFEQWLKFN